MQWLALGFAVVFNALANVLMKAGARHLGQGMGVGLLRHALGDAYLLLGIISFAVALGGYTLALTRLQLSVAYPLMTGIGFLIVAIAGAMLFGERLVPLRVVGMAVILLGIILVARTG